MKFEFKQPSEFLDMYEAVQYEWPWMKEKWTLQDFSNTNALGIKFGLAVIKIKVNPDSSFVQTW